MMSIQKYCNSFIVPFDSFYFHLMHKYIDAILRFFSLFSPIFFIRSNFVFYHHPWVLCTVAEQPQTLVPCCFLLVYRWFLFVFKLQLFWGALLFCFLHFAIISLLVCVCTLSSVEKFRQAKANHEYYAVSRYGNIEAAPVSHTNLGSKKKQQQATHYQTDCFMV